MSVLLRDSGLRGVLVSGLGLLCGFAAHQVIFIHGEWHVQAPQIFLGHVWFFFCFVAASVYYEGSAVGEASRVLLALFAGYIPGLLASIVLYRTFFHRLNGFRGPWYARVSKLWHVWAARDCKNHLVLEKLHEQYGDFVRTGE